MEEVVGQVVARRACRLSLQEPISLRWAIATFVVVVLLGPSGCDRQPTERAIKRDVYLLLIDTLRADHLSLYGYERPTSPNLERFAESATVFEKVVAAAPWTLPSVGSVMTGAYPSVHGLRAKARARNKKMTGLRPAVTTFAEVLAREGYRTVAIVTNPWLTVDRHGLARGFQEYLALEMQNAPAVHELAREVIARDDPRPLFLYLHYMDPHGPYDRHPDLEAADLGPLPAEFDRKLTAKEKLSLPAYLRLPRVTDLGSYVRAYDRAIRAWDDSFGDWIAWLDARASDATPLVAIIADHGEEFVERGTWSHGETLYEEQLWVPWLLRLPDRSPSRVSDRVVSLVDVAPTLLAALGIPVPETMMGSDVLSDEFQRDRPVFAETDVRIGGVVDPRYMQRSVRRGDKKHIQRPSGPECYDLAIDRAERRSSCAAADWLSRAESDIDGWTRANAELADSLGAAAIVEVDLEQQERLRAIGYLQ